MMRIALVRPPGFDLYDGDEVEKEEIRPHEPLGLLYLGAMIYKNHDVFILDAHDQHLSMTEVVQKIINFKPDVVGISVVFSQFSEHALTLASLIKKCLPHVVVVFGGNHATFMCKTLIRYPSIDAIVLGEGENIFSRIIQNLAESKKFSEGLPSLAFKEDDKIFIRPLTFPAITDLDSLPFPARNLLPQSIKYNRGVVGSRGCPFACFYCSTTAFWGTKVRFRSPENIISELKEMIDRYHISKFGFADDNFLVNKGRAMRFCRLLSEERLSLRWGISTRIEHIDNEILKELRKAGCNGIFLGIESGSERTLQRLNRKYTPTDVLRIINQCRKEGFRLSLSFMIGLPFEQKEDILRTFDLIEQCPADCRLLLSICTVFPGTPLHQERKKFGIRILNKTKFARYSLDFPSFSTKFLSAQSIHKLYLQGIGIIMRKNREKVFLDLDRTATANNESTAERR